MASRKVSRSSNGSSRTISVAFHVVRLLLVVLLALIFLISTVYFIRTIDAIGDDVDEARETHWGHTHEVEETPLNIEGSSGGGGKFDPYEADSAGDREENVASPRGRLILGKNYNEYAVTRSRAKQQHIVSLIVWVVLTLFAAILSLAGIIGALCGNMCMVREKVLFNSKTELIFLFILFSKGPFQRLYDFCSRRCLACPSALWNSAARPYLELAAARPRVARRPPRPPLHWPPPGKGKGRRQTESTAEDTVLTNFTNLKVVNNN